MKPHWTLDDIDWSAFEPAKLDPRTLEAVKAAAMVEFNAPDYVTYLCNVFRDYPDIQDTIRQWGVEEEQHGEALARYAALADPSFDFGARFKRFQEGYQIPLEAEESVRGSRAGEMLARCVVETGTSSFYSAIKDSTDEPVLKQIAHNIAQDEFRHYRLFYDVFQRFQDEEPSMINRLKIALGRMNEADDDELSYAYFCANEGGAAPAVYERSICADAYAARALGLYRRKHTDRVVSMVCAAVGLRPWRWLTQMIKGAVWFGFDRRARSLARSPGALLRG